MTVISWRKPLNDPVAEWGHLLAYFPQLKRRIERGQPRVLLLPPPQLGKSNEVNPREALNLYANEQQRAVQEIRRDAQETVTAYLDDANHKHLRRLLERQPPGDR